MEVFGLDKKALIYDGSTKSLFATDDNNILIMSHKDIIATDDKKNVETLAGKGRVSSFISNAIFKELEAKDIPTHYIDEHDETSSEIKKVDMLPFYVVIRNYAAGKFSEMMNVAEGTKLKTSTIELRYKSPDKKDNIINGYYALGLELAKESEIERLTSLSFKINDILKSFFDKLNIDLIDFKLEFGRSKGDIILADEITPDTCRLWDKNTHEKLDRDRFKRGLGHVMDAYVEVYRRLKAAKG